MRERRYDKSLWTKHEWTKFENVMKGNQFYKLFVFGKKFDNFDNRMETFYIFSCFIKQSKTSLLNLPENA